MKQVYEANDGEIFDTKEKCEEYELKHDYSSIKMMDNDFTVTRNPNSCYFFYAKTELDIERITNFFKEYGCSTTGIDKPGFYCWTNQKGGYYETFDERRKRLNNEIYDLNVYEKLFLTEEKK